MTRKITLLVLFVVLFISGGYAQQIYKKFRVDVGAGWGYSFRKGGGGLIVTMEPKYAIADKLSLGLHYAAVASGKDVEGQKISLVTRSYLLTGDYYFTQSNVRPFVGLGLGVIHVAVHGARSVTLNELTNVGGLIRTGIDVDHLHCRIALEYNQVPKSKFSLQGTNDITVDNSYMGITFSAYFGGRKKR